MEIRESRLFKAFADRHFGPKEELLYGLQALEIWKKKEPGRTEKSLLTQDGTSCITYHYYDQNSGVVFVLAGYLIRKGEPRPEELEAVEGYIRKIRAGLF